MPDLDRCVTLLVAAGIPSGIEKADLIDPAKVAIRLAGGRGFVKLAMHPHANALMHREVAAYAGPPPCAPFRRPGLLGSHDHGDWGAIWLTFEPGRVLTRWNALSPRPGPYEGAPSGLRPVRAILHDPLPPRFEKHRLRLLDRFADEPVRCGPIHGDFVYWNVLDGPAGPMLLDYEYFEPQAPSSQDRLQWTLLPLLRRAALWGTVPSVLAGTAVVPLATLLLPRGTARPALELALFLLRYATRLEEQQAEPDIADLYARPTRRIQQRLLALIDGILGRVVP
ncbi:hypothetical protein [Niveispirillum sp. KHB5.9]|uniref:hypothetical protein n=1 Tax=Niveispirillum sp. KHB5.9 TaxID=3400269 RepID=UPI003A838BE0